MFLIVCLSLKLKRSKKGVIDLVEYLKILSWPDKHEEEDVEETFEVRSLLDIMVEQKKKIEQPIEIILSHTNLAA